MFGRREIEGLKLKQQPKPPKSSDLERLRSAIRLGWGPPEGSGHYTADGKDKWAFQGREMADESGYLDAQTAYFGKMAMDNFRKWLEEGGNGHYTEDGLDKWAVDGVEVKNKDEYDLATVNRELDAIKVAASAAAKAGKSMKVTVGSYVRWVHDGVIYETESAWNEAKTKPAEDPDPGQGIDPVDPIQDPPGDLELPGNCIEILGEIICV